MSNGIALFPLKAPGQQSLDYRAMFEQEQEGASMRKARSASTEAQNLANDEEKRRQEEGYYAKKDKMEMEKLQIENDQLKYYHEIEKKIRDQNPELFLDKQKAQLTEEFMKAEAGVQGFKSQEIFTRIEDIRSKAAAGIPIQEDLPSLINAINSRFDDDDDIELSQIESMAPPELANFLDVQYGVAKVSYQTLQEMQVAGAKAGSAKATPRSLLNDKGEVVGEVYTDPSGMPTYSRMASTNEEVMGIPAGHTMGQLIAPRRDSNVSAKAPGKELFELREKISGQLATHTRTMKAMLSPDLGRVTGTFQGPLGEAFPVIENIFLSSEDQALKSKLKKQAVDNAFTVVRALAPVDKTDFAETVKNYIDRGLDAEAVRQVWLEDTIPYMLSKVESAAMEEDLEYPAMRRSMGAEHFLTMAISSEGFKDTEMAYAFSEWLPSTSSMQELQGRGEYYSTPAGTVMSTEMLNKLSHMWGEDPQTVATNLGLQVF